jgi:hypothetical protein
MLEPRSAYLNKPWISIITVDPSSTQDSDSQYKYYITRSSLPCVVVCATVYICSCRSYGTNLHLCHRSKPRQPAEPTRHQRNRRLLKSTARMSSAHLWCLTKSFKTIPEGSIFLGA